MTVLEEQEMQVAQISVLTRGQICFTSTANLYASYSEHRALHSGWFYTTEAEAEPDPVPVYIDHQGRVQVRLCIGVKLPFFDPSATANALTEIILMDERGAFHEIVPDEYLADL